MKRRLGKIIIFVVIKRKGGRVSLILLKMLVYTFNSMKH